MGSTCTRWSQLKKSAVNNSGVSDLASELAGLDSITEQQHWRDTWSHAIGAAYQVNPQLVFSQGAGWTPVDNLAFDVRQAQPALGLTYDANHENRANGFGGSMTHRF
ncbi:outer membrane protein transport protein [Pseudomonas poae]|nr:outer membrane protein transport protein [Pseudomonas poae]